mgnify:CR=1 FL=1
MQTGAVTFTRLNRVTYGEPVAKALAAAADRAGAARVFIMASQSLVARADEIGAVAEALGDRFCGLYSGMPAHTPRDAVLEAAAGARRGRADMIATVGGGSITDAAKAVTLALEHDLTEIADFDPSSCAPTRTERRSRPNTGRRPCRWSAARRRFPPGNTIRSPAFPTPGRA